MRDSPNQCREMGRSFSEKGMSEILRMYRNWARRRASHGIPEKCLFSMLKKLGGQ